MNTLKYWLSSLFTPSDDISTIDKYLVLEQEENKSQCKIDKCALEDTQSHNDLSKSNGSLSVICETENVMPQKSDLIDINGTSFNQSRTDSSLKNTLMDSEQDYRLLTSDPDRDHIDEHDTIVIKKDNGTERRLSIRIREYTLRKSSTKKDITTDPLSLKVQSKKRTKRRK